MKINGDQLVERITKIVDYNHARGWLQEPEDISKSIVMEAAELLEHYQWDASSKKLKTKNKPKDMSEIAFEVADIFWYLVVFCEVTKIDLVDALQKKMAHNEKKYPLEMFQGQHNSDFYLSQKKKYRASKKKNLKEN